MQNYNHVSRATYEYFKHVIFQTKKMYFGPDGGKPTLCNINPGPMPPFMKFQNVLYFQKKTQAFNLEHEKSALGEATHLMFRDEVVRPEVVRPELIRPEVVCPEVLRHEVARPEVVHPEVVRPAIDRTGMVLPEVAQRACNRKIPASTPI